jgi:hypothetical protein
MCRYPKLFKMIFFITQTYASIFGICFDLYNIISVYAAVSFKIPEQNITKFLIPALLKNTFWRPALANWKIIKNVAIITLNAKLLAVPKLGNLN